MSIVTLCYFVSDLHGHLARYRALFAEMERERPASVFVGGDLLPFFGGLGREDSGEYGDFVDDFLLPGLRGLRKALGARYPRVFVILGNDDPRTYEPVFRAADSEGLLEYVHGRKVEMGRHTVYGYSYVPPTPFQLKDWERYDVSRYVDPGCISPEEGSRSVEVPERRVRLATIKDDLDRLLGEGDLERAILMAHTPPYRTKLDRAALDGKTVDHVPLDLHIGSIALKRAIESRRPAITLHGHVHESARLTGSWRDRIGRTHLFTAAHDGPELALVRFDPDHPEKARRDLV